MRGLLASALLSTALMPVAAGAQQLAGEVLDVRHGLSHNEVSGIHQDRLGYLWLATWEGLARYDGRRFERFGPSHGLPPRVLNAVTEDENGTIWVATNGSGLARMVDAPVPRFELIGLGLGAAADSINDLIVDDRQRIWCLTDAGLIVGEQTGDAASRRSQFRHMRDYRGPAPGTLAFRDRHRRVWFGMGRDLLRADDTGARDLVGAYPTPDGQPIVGLADGSISNLVVVTTRTVFEFDPNRREPWRASGWRAPEGTAFRIAARALGALWIGSAGSVFEIRDGRMTRWRVGQGLQAPVSALREDRDGNFWIGTTQGLYRVTSRRILQFSPGDGTLADPIAGLLTSPDGRVFAATTDAGLVELSSDGVRQVRGTPVSLFNGVRGRVVVTAQGKWFVGSDHGIHRLRMQPGDPLARIDPAPLLRLRAPERLHLDSSGRLWVRLADRSVCLRVEGDRLVIDSHVAPRDGAPTFMTIAQSLRGSLWIGDMTTLYRLNAGVLERLDTSTGLPETRPRSLLIDSRGWLWVGLRYQGLAWTREPDARVPRFESLSTADGLSSDTVSCVVEGRDGHVYIGTGRGLNRVDPHTGRVETVGPAGVLTGAWVRSCVTDRAGRIWAATVNGVARVDTRDGDSPPERVPLYITRVEVGGTPIALPSRGRQEVKDVVVRFGAGSLRVHFASPTLRRERRVSYEYRMVELDRAWQAADDTRTIEYGQLPAGSYRFEVRAVTPGTETTHAVATVFVTALAPVWAQAWFKALVGSSLLCLGLAAHRLRVRQVLALERLRRQVALDLHDDLGSGLAQIAILSEVAKRDESRARILLDDMAKLSRTLRESMADIVWAVDPRFDTLQDVVARIRETASNLIESRGIAMNLDASPGAELHTIRLDAPVRRHLLMIAKELLTNAARHSGASRLDVRLHAERGVIALVVADNGRGFDPAAAAGSRQGQGLRNLRQRAADLGGTIAIRSSSAGTETHVSIPTSTQRRAQPPSHGHAIDTSDAGA